MEIASGLRHPHPLSRYFDQASRAESCLHVTRNSITEQLFRRFYASPPGDPFYQTVLETIQDKNPQLCLDAGCGSGNIFRHDFKQRVGLLIGIDAREDLASNLQLHVATRAYLEALPVQPNTFDLVFSRFVLEHIEFPLDALLEIRRIMRPSATLIVQVPNAVHYFPLANRLLPQQIKRQIIRAVGYREMDAFRAYYRANTTGKLTRLAKLAGFRPLKIIMSEPSPWFLRFFPPALALGILYERIVNRFEVLSPLRAHIIAVFLKV